jgi:integrase
VPRAKARRQYGTGSVYQRASDGRWLGTIEHGFTRSGARRRVTVTGKSEAEVKAKIKAKQREIARGEDTAGRTTVKAWAATWLTMTSTSVRPKTHVTDKGAVRYIVAAIGHRRLDQLTPADVRAVRTAVTDDGLSTSTALRYHGTLMRMLKKARDEGHDVAARVLAVRPPTKAVSDRRAIPLPDSLALLSVAAELGHGSRWVAALLQGMRQGECLGLTWEQVDLDAGSLTISWQLQALNYRDKSNRRAGFLIPDGYEVRQLEGRMHLVRPKSDAGWRVIPLVPWMTNALQTWQRAAPASPHGLVWPALDGSPADAVEDRDEWRTMQDTVGVRHPGGRHYHVHEARHATAMLLLACDVPESVRIQIMGHSSIASTRAYEHTDIELAREALGRVTERLQLALG